VLVREYADLVEVVHHPVLKGLLARMKFIVDKKNYNSFMDNLTLTERARREGMGSCLAPLAAIGTTASISLNNEEWFGEARIQLTLPFLQPHVSRESTERCSICGAKLDLYAIYTLKYVFQLQYYTPLESGKSKRCSKLQLHILAHTSRMWGARRLV